ncbi:glycosyltransferase family 9 protein [Pelagibacterales bacterium SAG-MED29]|nr:glycosyltransferase family 9 protein [Pelagibacterales bacterium SAG-MED29]
MNYLIFRTDRIGDFLITSTLIKAIKRNDSNSKISIVASNKNKDFIRDYNFVDEVFVLKSKNIADRFNLLLQLRKKKYDNIIIADKKNRSIFLSIFLKSRNKIFNVSKKMQKNLLSFFYKNVFLDNDSFNKQTAKDILKNNCTSLNYDLKDEDFHYLRKDQFINEYSHNNLLNLEKLDFLLFHYDEKWEIKNYSKLFKKATELTDININLKDFINFLSKLAKKTSKKIVVTTGMIETKIINELKGSSNKINEFVYEIDLNNTKAHLLINENFFSVSHIISKSSLFVTCHGAFTHIASNYNIKILDIIEKDKDVHYSKITNHMKNYKLIYRDNFLKLSEDIINNS